MMIRTVICWQDGTPIERAAVAFSYNDLWNRTLSLLSADHGHAGVYVCRVGMRTGGPRLTREARVKVIGEMIVMIMNMQSVAHLQFQLIQNGLITLVIRTIESANLHIDSL